MKYGDEICYQEVIYDANFDINKLAKLVELDDIIILKIMKT